jgi:hypothetical protein
MAQRESLRESQLEGANEALIALVRLLARQAAAEAMRDAGAADESKAVPAAQSET